MKKLIGLLAAALLAFSAPAVSQAAGETGVYVAPKLMYGHASYNANGYSFSKSQFGGALAGGYDFWNNYAIPIRGELEIGTYSKFKSYSHGNSMTADATSLMANAYVDWHTASAFTPYAQVGLGLAFVKGQYNSYLSDSNTNIGFNLGFGVAYQLTDNIAIDLGYRYANLGRATSYTDEVAKYIKSDRVDIHNLMLGARFSF